MPKWREEFNAESRATRKNLLESRYLDASIEASSSHKVLRSGFIPFITTRASGKPSARISAMAQKNPPGQNDFLATALERELLAIVGGGGTFTAEEIVGSFPNPTAARNALEGCLAKQFVTQDEAGNLFLTGTGRRQI